jgi:glucans biosynthesis protein
MSGNPTHAAVWSKNLTLAQACPRCGARTRSGGRCKGMQMANGRCRMHGGASPGAPRGDGHGMFKHGLRSIEIIEHRRKMRTEMRRIRREMQELGCD